MVTLSAKARRFIFIAGLALIAFGAYGLLTNAPWGSIANSLFTIFGTTASFAQFSIGFSSLKPTDGGDAKAQPSPQVTQPPLSSVDRTAVAILIGSSGQVNLGFAQLAIGRAPDNQHVMSDSHVSEHHAIIRPEGQGYTITDLESTNGTYVNGQRLTARVPHPLTPGDTIRFGTSMFTYKVIKTPEIATTVRAPEPLYPPPQSYTPLPASTSIPVGGTQKTYYGSGIALLLSGIFTFIYLLLILSAPTPTESQLSLQSGAFGLTFIFVLGGLRGFYAKQAHRAGWLGTIGTMMLAASSILNVVISCLIVVNASSNQPFSPGAMSTILTLLHVNLFFLTIGDIILGISIILVGVYPRWTGIALTVVGCLDLIYALVPLAWAIQVIAVLLVVAIFSQWGLTLMKPAPNSQQQYLRH